MKLTNDQCFEICKYCISYLYDQYSHEKGLFKSTVSLTEVRQQQKLILDKTKTTDEIDPYILTEVLLVTLRDMPNALLHQIYDRIVSTGKKIDWYVITHFAGILNDCS